MTDMYPYDNFLQNKLDNSISELSRFCEQPSVAAQNLGLQACANLAGELLRARGFNVEILATGGAPVVFGEKRGRVDKTILFYNHYDVQPPEPLELWDSPPFTHVV
jgi:acetylornithine deacetylase/succinyl-diaminopimelate desuccinylase-like protein